MSTIWSTETFKAKINEINPNIEVLGEYANAHVKIECRCKIDGHIWNPTPTHLLHSGRGCPKCNGGVRKTHEEFIQQVKIINPLIEIIGIYQRDNEKMSFKCLIDGTIWETKPTHIIQGHGCPKCNESIGKKTVVTCLNKNNLMYIREYRFKDCKDKYNLPFDFYIPDLDTCIEYDGTQHFKARDVWGGEAALKGVKRRDKIKTDYCKYKGINLIRIPYTEKNIEQYLQDKLDGIQITMSNQAQLGF